MVDFPVEHWVLAFLLRTILAEGSLVPRQFGVHRVVAGKPDGGGVHAATCQLNFLDVAFHKAGVSSKNELSEVSRHIPT